MSIASVVRVAVIEARSPATWLAAACGCGPLVMPAAGIGEMGTGLQVPVAIACGGLAAAATLGEPPFGFPDGRRQWLPLWIGRLALPVLAIAAAAVALATVGPAGRAVWLTAAAVCAGGVLAAGTMAVARAAVAGREAAATSVGLVTAAAAAAAGLVGGWQGGGPGWQLGLSLPVGFAAGGGLVMLGSERATPSGFGGLWSPLVPVEPVSAFGGRLGGVAMVTALVGMMVCYFLAPQIAAGYTLLALAWFVCLAVPAATPCTTGRAGDWLVRSAVGRPVVPGSTRAAVSTAVAYAALLGWPAIVAMLLPAPAGPRAMAPWVTLVCLAVAAVAVTAIVGTAGGTRARTTRAVCLALVATVILWTATAP